MARWLWLLPILFGPGCGACATTDVVLLVADYWGKAGGSVKIRLNLQAPAEVIALEDRARLAR